MKGANTHNTIVCVDSYQNSILTGTIINPYLDENIPFCGITQFLKEINRMLDNEMLASSNTELSTRPTLLGCSANPRFPETLLNCRGAVSTFILDVRFRQHNSWQGTITWLEHGVKDTFRSVLELIMLLDRTLRF